MTYPQISLTFHGDDDNVPMVWSIDIRDDGQFGVIESYDGEQTWGTNCICPTWLDALNFIYDWFTQFGE